MIHLKYFIFFRIASSDCYNARFREEPVSLCDIVETVYVNEYVVSEVLIDRLNTLLSIKTIIWYAISFIHYEIATCKVDIFILLILIWKTGGILYTLKETADIILCISLWKHKSSDLNFPCLKQIYNGKECWSCYDDFKLNAYLMRFREVNKIRADIMSRR